MIQTNSRKCVPNSHSFHIIYNQSETQTGINTIPSFVCVPMETSIGISIEKNINPDVLKMVCIKKSMSTIKIQSLLFPTSHGADQQALSALLGATAVLLGTAGLFRLL